jgi:hypothetical protein
LANVLVSKHADHLPLYRQRQIFDREGLDLDRSTLADWVGKTTALLEPLADAIGRIAQLYAVEKEARGFAPHRRAEPRGAHAAPVFSDLERGLALQLTTISGKSPVAAAIRNALTRLDRRHPCLDHGILKEDNNTAKRGIAIALGRKNHIFVGPEADGKAAAIAFPLIETAKLNAVDPSARRADTPAPIPDLKFTKVDAPLPWRRNR